MELNDRVSPPASQPSTRSPPVLTHAPLPPFKMTILFPTRRLTEAQLTKEAKILSYGQVEYAKESIVELRRSIAYSARQLGHSPPRGTEEDRILDSLLDRFAHEARRAAIERIHGKGFVINGHSIECLFNEPYTAAFEALVEVKAVERYKEVGMPYTPKPKVTEVPMEDLLGLADVFAPVKVETSAAVAEAEAILKAVKADAEAILAAVKADAATILATARAEADAILAAARAAPAARSAPVVAQMRICEGCRNRVCVSVPVDTQSFEFKCPVCSYSVRTNCF